MKATNNYLYISKSQWGYSVWQVGCGYWHRLWSGWEPIPSLECAVEFARNLFADSPHQWEVLPKSKLPEWFDAGSNEPQEF